MPLVRAVAQVVLDVLYVWAIVLAALIAFAVFIDRARTRYRRRQELRVARLEEEAEFRRKLIHAERERRETLRCHGGVEVGPR